MECPIVKDYKGYRLSGEAESVINYGQNWYATGRVWVNRPDNSSIMADYFRDRLLIYEDRETAKCIGLWLAEISVDNFLPPVEYYLTPMNAAWAVTILRRGAEECKKREIRRSKLYEALDFLEKNIDAPELVRKISPRFTGGSPRRIAERGALSDSHNLDSWHTALGCSVIGKQNESACSEVS